MNLILFDDLLRYQLLPLTFVRPMAELRIGITTIREKWEQMFCVESSSTITDNYLSAKFPFISKSDNLLVNGAIIPNESLVEEINALSHNQALVTENYVVALRLSSDDLALFSELGEEIKENEWGDLMHVMASSDHTIIQRPWELFKYNEGQIICDFERITKGRISAALSATNTVIGGENIFVEAGAKVEGAILNGSTGPIYIGKDVEIMEGAMLRGPLALCEHATIKMGAKIYGGTTIGPWSKVGGEVASSIIMGYSNKAHDGFLGNSVLGHWCNLGADTNTSNLKNTYDEVRMYSYPEQSFIPTNEIFVGMIMGDYSKTGINTMLNTGTVVGVNANIFGEGYPRNFIPSFSWGGKNGFKKYIFSKAIESAKIVTARREVVFDGVDESILKEIYDNAVKI